MGRKRDTGKELVIKAKKSPDTWGTSHLQHILSWASNHCGFIFCWSPLLSFLTMKISAKCQGAVQNPATFNHVCPPLLCLLVHHCTLPCVNLAPSLSFALSPSICPYSLLSLSVHLWLSLLSPSTSLCLLVSVSVSLSLSVSLSFCPFFPVFLPTYPHISGPSLLF